MKNLQGTADSILQVDIIVSNTKSNHEYWALLDLGYIYVNAYMYI